jgi:hypothetical protein
VLGLHQECEVKLSTTRPELQLGSTSFDKDNHSSTGYYPLRRPLCNEQVDRIDALNEAKQPQVKQKTNLHQPTK